MILFVDAINKNNNNYIDFIRDLKKFLKEEEPELTDKTYSFLRRLKNTTSIQKIEQALLSGQFDDEETFAKWQEEYTGFVDSKLSKKWIIAMIAGASFIKHSRKQFTFDLKYPATEKWLQSYGAEFVREITRAQKETLNILILRTAKSNVSPDALAKQIQSVIGLTRKQAIANQNYYLKRIESILKVNPAIDKQKAEKIAAESAAKYAKRQLNSRAMIIARTELARAYHAGEYYGIKQAQTEGLIGKIVKRISTAGDRRVCEDCKTLDGETMELDDLVLDGLLFPPWHPCCRCEVEYIEIEKPIFMVA